MEWARSLAQAASGELLAAVRPGWSQSAKVSWIDPPQPCRSGARTLVASRSERQHSARQTLSTEISTFSRVQSLRRGHCSVFGERCIAKMALCGLDCADRFSRSGCIIFRPAVNARPNLCGATDSRISLHLALTTLNGLTILWPSGFPVHRRGNKKPHLVGARQGGVTQAVPSSGSNLPRSNGANHTPYDIRVN